MFCFVVSSAFVSSSVVSSLVTSSLVLSCFVLYSPVLSCLTSPCLVLSCLVLSCLVLFHLPFSCSFLSFLVLSCLILSCFVSSCCLVCVVLSCFTHLVLSCLVLSDVVLVKPAVQCIIEHILFSFWKPHFQQLSGTLFHTSWIECPRQYLAVTFCVITDDDRFELWIVSTQVWWPLLYNMCMIPGNKAVVSYSAKWKHNTDFRGWIFMNNWTQTWSNVKPVKYQPCLCVVSSCCFAVSIVYSPNSPSSKCFSARLGTHGEL